MSALILGLCASIRAMARRPPRPARFPCAGSWPRAMQRIRSLPDLPSACFARSLTRSISAVTGIFRTSSKAAAVARLSGGPGGQPDAWAITERMVAADVTSRSYSGGRNSPPMNTCSRRNCMPPAAGSSAAKWISRGLAAATMRSTLRAVMPPPGMTMIRSPARRTSSAISGRPSSTLASWPEVKHAVDAQTDQRLQRCERIGRHVEGAVKGDREGPGPGDQRARPFHVDRAVGFQKADHHAVGAFRLGGVDVGLHDREFIVVEEEIAAARPDHHLELDAGDRPRLADHAAARRDAAFQEIGAELDAVRAGRLGGAHARHRIHADFVDHGSLFLMIVDCQASC